MHANTNTSQHPRPAFGGTPWAGAPYVMPSKGKPQFDPQGGNPIREMQGDVIRQKIAERQTARLSTGAAKEMLNDAQRNLGRIVGKAVGSLGNIAK